MRTALLIGLSLFTAVDSFPAKAADTPSPTTAILTDPVWRAQPVGSELWKFYPDLAFWEGINGVAVIACTVTDAGQLTNCKIYGEDPKREGFGFALTKIANFMAVEPASASGMPTAGRTVRLGAQFKRLPLDTNLFRHDPSPNKALFRSKSVSVEVVTVQR
jgi:TonB family protein